MRGERSLIIDAGATGVSKCEGMVLKRLLKTRCTPYLGTVVGINTYLETVSDHTPLFLNLDTMF